MPQLKFEPAGRGHAGDSFYLSVKDNICVVCGATEHLMRFHGTICSHTYTDTLSPLLLFYFSAFRLVFDVEFAYPCSLSLSLRSRQWFRIVIAASSLSG